MVNEFDKEIDAMLRDLAKGDTFAQVLPDLHLDADEISAFAENALPKKARLRTMEHLSDCSKCRKILSNTVFLNSENQSEIIHEEAKTIAVIASIPWYQRFFALPKLSYAMGGLALLLCGMIGLIVFKEGNNSPMVAQKPMESANKTSDKSGSPNLEGDFPMNENYASNSAANAPSAMATPTVNSPNAPASNSASKDVTPNSPAEPESSPALKIGEEPTSLNDKKTSDDETSFASKSGQPTDLAKKETDAKPVGTPVSVAEDGGERRDVNKNEVSQKQASELAVQNRSNQIMTPDGQGSRNYPSPPPSPVSGASREGEKRSEPKAKKMQEKSDTAGKDASGENRRVGNKSFRKVDGGWTDTSYSGGSTKNVRRGSNDYKKLDSRLQNIGNSLSGTVIVVWGGKNYKIQ